MKKKIIFAHQWWRVGGAEKVLLDWIKSIRSTGNFYLIDVVCNAHEESDLSMKEEFNSNVDEQYAINNMYVDPNGAIRATLQIINMEQPDVLFIMSNPYFYSILPQLSKISPNTKVVDLLHLEETGRDSWFSISDEYKEYLNRRYVISEFWKDVLVKKYKESPLRVSVAYNGVDTVRFSPVSTEYKKKERSRYGFGKNDKVVGFMGRFEFQKNPKVFTRLAEEMSEMTNYKFIMVGWQGEKYEEISMADERENLRILPMSKNPEKMYALFDVCVFPSRFEGYPLVGIECASMNIPIIATNVPGFSEQINDGGFGLCYEQSSSVIDDAKKIKQMLIENWDMLVKIGNKGRKFVLKRHDKKNIYATYLKLINELV